MAILETIKLAIQKSLTKITIFSDSKSVLQALQNISFGNRRSHLINKIKDHINQVKKRG